MHPVLFEIFGLKLHTYGALMGLGFLLGMHLITHRAKQLNFSETHLNRLLLIGFAGGIIGARLLYVLVDNPIAYIRNPIEIFRIWRGGLVFFGGFIIAIGSMSIYMLKHDIKIGLVCDMMVAPFTLGHAVGRLGCFMAGCCYGKICHLPWAVTFHDPNGVGLKNVPLHPTQIYEASFLFALAMLLLVLRRYKRFHGMLILIYFILYGIGRSLLELLRNDMRGALWGLSTAQWMSIPLVLMGAILLVRFYRQRPSLRTL